MTLNFYSQMKLVEIIMMNYSLFAPPPPYPAHLGSIISRTTAETEDDPTIEIILQTKSCSVFLSERTEETSVKSKEQKLEDSNSEKSQSEWRVIFSIIVFLLQNELSKIIS